MVVHGAGGLDELTPTGENLVAEVRDGEVAPTRSTRARWSTGPVPGSPDDLRVRRRPGPERGRHPDRVRRRARARAATPSS